MTRHEARKNYIDKVIAKLQKYIEKEYTILYKGRVVSKVMSRGNLSSTQREVPKPQNPNYYSPVYPYILDYNFGISLDNLVIYDHEADYMIPIASLRDRVSEIKLIHPKHIKKLRVA